MKIKTDDMCINCIYTLDISQYYFFLVIFGYKQKQEQSFIETNFA